MKRLTQFQKFEFDRFVNNKIIVVLGHDEWINYDTGEVIGYKYKLTILEDNTDYGNGQMGLNDGESFTVKIEGELKQYSKLQEVKLQNVEATVYGDYSNNLSVTASSIIFKGGTENDKA